MSNRVTTAFVYTDIEIKLITEAYLTKFYVTKFISALFNCHQPIIHLIAKLIPLFKQRSPFLPFLYYPGPQYFLLLSRMADPTIKVN